MKLSPGKWILMILLVTFIHTKPNAGILGISKAHAAQMSKEETSIPGNQVELWSRDRPLGEVLQEVHEKSGIQFHLPETLWANPVAVNIRGHDWKSATEQLVKEYARIEVWSADPENSTVWLLGSNQQVLSLEPLHSFHAPKTQPKLEIALLPENDSVLDILPQELLVEPALWMYLQSLGVSVPEEVQELFGSALKSPPSEIETPSHILNHPELNDYLDSAGIEVDSGVRFSD